MNRSYWREKAAPIINEIIQANPTIDDREVKQLISNAYPFGQRAYHPYKIWLSEVKRQMLSRHYRLTSQCKQEKIDDLQLFSTGETHDDKHKRECWK